MADKIWDEHAIGDDLLYIDLHLVHEVSSPQAFEGLRAAGRRVRRVDRTIATADHNVPTWDLSRPNDDPVSQAQLDALERNVAEFGVPYYGLGHARLVPQSTATDHRIEAAYGDDALDRDRGCRCEAGTKLLVEAMPKVRSDS